MFNNLTEIKEANERIGYHWFDESSMAFFDSILYPTLIQHPEGAFFVSSERCDGGPRLYTARFARLTGEVNTVGPFQGFGSWAEAYDWATEQVEQYEADQDR
jgi:hypothetical protein